MGMSLKLREVRKLKIIKGIAFPAWVKFRQLIVTGPPGSGKTSLVETIGGWPGEGYLDLSSAHWWRSPILAVRPREVHLGFPFRGRDEALALFEPEWLESDPRPHPELKRVRLPPRLWGWRKRFVFEFLLPEASEIFARRQERSYDHTHPIDKVLSEELIREQLAIYGALARAFHRAGMAVYVREKLTGVPKVIDEPARAETRYERHWMRDLAKACLDKLGPDDGTGEMVEDFDPLRLVGRKVRIHRRVLPIELTLEPQRLRVVEDPSFRAAEAGPRPLLLFDPEDYASRVWGFVRLEWGERIRIGKGEEDRRISLKLPEEILPRLEIVHEGEYVTVIDLHSPTGTVVETLRAPEEVERLARDRRRRIARVGELYGGPIAPLPADEALACLRQVNRDLERDPRRPRDSRGRPGGLVELPDDVVPVIVGDLHANVDNLLGILCENRFLEETESGRGAFVLLGDAVHHEEGELEAMEDSLLIMDVILKLMAAFPGRFFYLRGNHDSFSPEVTKEGVPQGHLWGEWIRQVRGDEHFAEMERFYDLLPYVAVSGDFVACHAGPPMTHTTRDQLIDVGRSPKLRYQLTWNRLKASGNPGGYTKSEVQAWKRGLGLRRSAVFIVSHNPLSEEETVWLDAGGIKRHHLLYSARRDRFAIFTRIGTEMVALSYPSEPLRERVTPCSSDGYECR